ncbi:muconate cycloisomerase [Marinomonas mediterranea]|uniref:muconate/chloromuconate family cycloisomerase n=1 Tax=Marinomonas mediterranea TaxID=119864 RepID=UPI00234A031F|nr:muconate/chloromuconate family cycloisomerase [Marinomonas mediterranea]WCN14833.1 muconate cycloisomerase [Marinomonas mediterranea]
MTPKITQIETLLVDIPTIRPHKLSMTSMAVQTMVIVRLKDDQGSEGLGEGTTIGGLAYGPESPESIKMNIDRYLAPLLIGQSTDSVRYLMQRLNVAVKGNMIAKSALQTALVDLKGKHLGVPVSSLLGGAIHSHIPCLWVLASGNTEKDIAEAKELIAAGRHCDFKLKIGSRPVEEDVAHVAAIKAALGDSASVRVDVNQAWDEATAVKGMAALQEAGVDLVEQPTPAKDIDTLARLSNKFEIPILADEGVADSKDVYQFAKQGFNGGIALKIAKAGGPIPALEAAVVSESAGFGLYGGTLLEGSIGTAVAIHAWSTLPTLRWGSEMFGPLLLQDDIIKQPLRYHNNGVDVPNLPGLGIELDELKLAEYQRKD